MALAGSLQKIASKLTGKFGGFVTIRFVSNGVYNATSGTISETSTDLTIKGVLEDIKRSEVNDLVQASDKKLMISSADLSGSIIGPDDCVLIGGVVHQIVTMNIIEQANQPIVHELFLRA